MTDWAEYDAQIEAIYGGIDSPAWPHYDRAGKRIRASEFVTRFADNDYRRVAQDIVGPYLVSTCWLGFNHNYSLDPASPPLIFETMVFDAPGSDDGLIDRYLRRYPTEDAARAGHAAILAEIRAVEELAGTFEVSERPGQPGKNAGDGAGLAGRRRHESPASPPLTVSDTGPDRV